LLGLRDQPLSFSTPDIAAHALLLSKKLPFTVANILQVIFSALKMRASMYYLKILCSITVVLRHPLSMFPSLQVEVAHQSFPPEEAVEVQNCDIFCTKS
jgi:hypothetical protein